MKDDAGGLGVRGDDARGEVVAQLLAVSDRF